MLPIILLIAKGRYLYVVLRFTTIALSRLDLVQDFRYGFALVKMIFYTLDLLIILMPLAEQHDLSPAACGHAVGDCLLAVVDLDIFSVALPDRP